MPKKSKSPEKDAKAVTIAKRVEAQKKALIDQLRRNPVLESACRMAGIGRTTAYRWAKEDGIFANVMRSAQRHGKDFVSDMAESQLIKLIRDGNLTAIIFWLKTHKRADFAELIQHEHHMAKPSPLTPEDKKEAFRAFIYSYSSSFPQLTEQDIEDAIKREYDMIDNLDHKMEKRIEDTEKRYEDAEE